MTISIIVAHDKNHLIGNGNKLPWYLPNDLKYFKKVTDGSIIIMGRNTHESIGKPLYNRCNFVLSRDKSYKPYGCVNWYDFDALVKYLGTVPQESFVIGGANIYKQFLPLADYLYITEIDKEFEGDTYFPEYSLDEWKLVRVTKGIVDDKNKYPHKFKIYKRK